MDPTRRALLAGLVALPGCRWLRRQQANVITPSYGAFPGEGPERSAAFDVLDAVLDESNRAGVSRTRAAQRGIEAFARILNARSIDPDPALHNEGAGPTLVVDARDHERVVVFSDHHLGPSTHRHNVFSGPGGRHFRANNHALYEAVLDRYFDAEFTLVENGDVEDLVVFDPADHPGEFAFRAALVTPLDTPAERLQALNGRRDAFRRQLLAETLADPRNQTYYRTITRFDRAGRLFRLAGNHDYARRAMWDAAVDEARRAVPDAVFPSADRFGAILALQRGEAWETVLLHGHQFDHSSSPLNAALHGETISECLGIWYQGADRIWPWTEWCAQWCGGRPFTNRLVTGSPETEAALRAAAQAWGPYSKPHREEARQRMWARPFGPRTFEGLFEHPVAWEYLTRPGDDDDALVGVFRAVVAGEAWFKYRHTEELELASILRRLVPGGPPNVVLGHTHEPRAGALDAFGEPVDWYLNAAATGRFEGLIWAVEIDHGQARVVSWHADPFPDGRPTRRVWRPAGAYRELLQSEVEALS